MKNTTMQKAIVNKYSNQGFDQMQVLEIREGVEKRLDISVYADVQYSYLQMREIRLGLERGINVSEYCNSKLDWFQMEEIRIGLQNGLDVSQYNDSKNDYMLMREIRKSLESGVDIRAYVQKGYKTNILREIRKSIIDGVSIDEYIGDGYDSDQLEEIRQGIRNGIDVRHYLNKLFSGSQMKEIRLGLEEKIDVSAYCDTSYSWQQMRELRLGIKRNLETFWYDSCFYSPSQMREIRLGLLEGVNVFSYALHVWSASDMKKMRLKLLSPKESEEDDISVEELTKQINIALSGNPTEGNEVSVEISPDENEAYIIFSDIVNKHYSDSDLINILNDYNVTKGINTNIIEEIANGKRAAEGRILIAQGLKSIDGIDGKYVFFFRRELPSIPKVRSDNSVDYKNIDLFESVSENQKIAEYTAATNGRAGYTVTGKNLIPKHGRELPKLKGNGYKLLQDGRTYISMMNGRIELKHDEVISISSQYTVDGDVTSSVGNIRFDGDICIKGFVGSGVTIEATGDIIINGNVETAIIRAGRDVLIRSGVCASEDGLIQAGNNIFGKYFEKIKLVADNNIQSNYILNCDCDAGGKIIISGRKGAIVGGATSAIQGVEAYNIGNVAEIRTTIEVGKTERFRDKVRTFEKKIDKFKYEYMELSNKRHSLELERDLEELKSLTLYRNLLLSMKEKKKIIEKIDTDKEEYIKGVEKYSGTASVKVLEKAYRGTQIKIDSVTMTLDTAISRILFRRRGNNIVSFNLTIGMMSD